MIATNRQSLDNLDIRRQAAEALAKGIISGVEYQRIEEMHHVGLYCPNVFIRIGLFVLTMLVVACGLGLSVVIGGDGERGIAVTMIFWGVAAYGALELFIYNRNFYQAGVDDALLWMGGGLIFGGTAWLAGNLSAGAGSALVLVLAAWGMLRYADRLMALLAYGALISLVFHVITSASAFGMTVIPFVIMLVSMVAYFVFAGFLEKNALRHYHACLSVLQVAALVCLYAAGNYYVVQNVNGSLHGQFAHVALSWLWWSFTILVPLCYLAAGIRKKDDILIWTGLALVAATVLTIRYYYHVLSTEAAMILGGSILIGGAYAIIRYLRTPKHGFTSAAPDEPHVFEGLTVEALIVAESFKSVVPPQSTDQPPHFGGGSGGGAGAGGTY